MKKRAEDPDEVLLEARARLPKHVVHRDLAKQTVVLNLESGEYHGLNPTARHMFQMLQRGSSVREVARTLAREYDHPPQAIEADVLTLCRALMTVNLIELVDCE